MDTKARITELMIRHGWSEYRLAKESGLSQSTISNMFSRNTMPSISTLEVICDAFGITDAMQGTVLPQLQTWAGEYSFTLLDYEWGGSAITDDDTQFYDGFHLDEKYGLPQWTAELFGDIA